MRKKSAYAWYLVAALTMAACSSDQNQDVDVSGKTGTFEIAINFANPDAGTRASTVIPTTSWSNIKQIQFFLYDTGTGDIAWSEIETPATGTTVGTGKQYVYATVPTGNYTLVALANAQSNTDAVTTYTYTSPTTGAAELWTVANVYNRAISNLAIRHKAGAWSSLVAGNSAVSGLSPYTQPSEVFMGSVAVTVSTTSVNPVTVSLTREVSMMRVRVDQTTNASVAGDVDFDVANAGILLYNLPNQMGIGAGASGGVGAAVGGVAAGTTSTNVLSISGAYSTTTTGYLDGNYTSWKEAIVFPNNGGRANNSNTTAAAASPYFIVICGVAQAGHAYSGESIGQGSAAAGDPVYWYGQINEVFTPNIIREVNVLLKTGGQKDPPPGVVEYAGLDITVSSPEPWGSIVVTDPIEM